MVGGIIIPCTIILIFKYDFYTPLQSNFYWSKLQRVLPAEVTTMVLFSSTNGNHRVVNVECAEIPLMDQLKTSLDLRVRVMLTNFKYNNTA